jgi:hypothetical protein
MASVRPQRQPFQQIERALTSDVERSVWLDRGPHNVYERVASAKSVHPTETLSHAVERRQITNEVVGRHVDPDLAS